MLIQATNLKMFVVAIFLCLGGSQAVPASSPNVYCPQCGKFHAASTSTTISNATVPVETGHQMKSYSPTPSGAAASNVFATLNAQRSRQGIGQLGFDPQLQVVAEQRAALMARTGNKSHPPGSYAPGTYEGVGWSSTYSPTAVSACYTSDQRMKVAGAAMATGRDGVYFAVVYR